MKTRIRDPKLTEFSYKKIHARDMPWKFGCNVYEEWVADWINRALYDNKFPDFSAFDDYSVGGCYCREDSCYWNEERVTTRLKELGMWERIEEILSPVKTRIAATFTADGGVEINGVKYPYLAGLPYLYDDSERELRKLFPNGYVVFAKHDGEYVWYLPDGSYKLIDRTKV